MDAIITQLNSIGRSFVIFAVPMLIQSSLLIFILLGLNLIFGKKTRAVFRYGLLLLILVKLVLPTTLSAPTGIGYWVGGNFLNLPAQSQIASTPPITGGEPAGPPPLTTTSQAVDSTVPLIDLQPGTEMAEHEAVPTPGPAEPVSVVLPSAIAITWPAIALLIWLAVVAAMVLLLIQRLLFVRGLIAQSSEADGPLLVLLEDCRNRLAIKKPISLKISPNATSPAVCGLFRPMILIPQNMPEQLDSRHLSAVLLHELGHIKRRDLWINLAQTVLQIVYFYNPLLWLANAVIRRVREQAVDEMVLVAMGEKHEEYPDTLLAVARLSLARPALSLRLIGVVESKKALTQRIKHIISRPLPKTAKLGLLGLAAVIIIAAILLPMAKGEPKKNESAAAEESISELERAKSGEFMRQILLACHMYAADNQGYWPTELQVLVKDGYLKPPEKVDLSKQYVYIRPPMNLAPDSTGRFPVVYEAFEAWQGGVVSGFADGHVQVILDEDNFKELLSVCNKIDLAALERMVQQAEHVQVVETILMTLTHTSQPYGSGRGIARVSRLGHPEETTIVDFRYKDDLTRFDRYELNEENERQLLFKQVMTPRSKIRCDGNAALVEPPDNLDRPLYRFGEDMHPRSFNAFYGLPLERFLGLMLERHSSGKSKILTSFDEFGHLQVKAELIYKDSNRSDLLEFVIDIKEGYRIVSARALSTNDEGEGSRTDLIYEADWQKFGGQWYVNSAKLDKHEVEVLDREGKPISPQKNHTYTKVDILEYVPRAEINEKDFTLSGMGLDQGTLVRDKIRGLNYRYGEQSTEPLTFGPVIERVVKGGEFVDFGSGRVLAPPDDLDLSDEEVLSAWAKRNAMDARIVIDGESRGLQFFDVFAGSTTGSVADKQWNEIIPGRLEKGSRDAWWGILRFGMMRDLDKEAQRIRKFCNGTQKVTTDNLPMTMEMMGFGKGNEPPFGLLQIVGFTEDPKGLKIRYKMVQGAQPATQADDRDPPRTWDPNWVETSRRRLGAAKIRSIEANAEARRLLAIKHPRFDYEEVPLSEVFDDLRAKSGLNIIPNWPSLTTAGIEKDRPVTLQLHNVSLEQALKEVLSILSSSSRNKATISYVIRDGLVAIASIKDLAGDYYIVAYEISDLLGEVSDGRGRSLGESYGTPRQRHTDRGGGEAEGEEERTELLERIVALEPGSWKENGGQGTAAIWGTKLLIYQTAEIQAKIRDRLKQMRETRRKEISKDYATVVYDIHDLIRDPTDTAVQEIGWIVQAGKMPQTAVSEAGTSADEIITVIKKRVSPASWQSAGGAAIIQLTGSRLTIMQTPENHQEIRKLLGELREERQPRISLETRFFQIPAEGDKRLRQWLSKQLGITLSDSQLTADLSDENTTRFLAKRQESKGVPLLVAPRLTVSNGTGIYLDARRGGEYVVYTQAAGIWPLGLKLKTTEWTFRGGRQVTFTKVAASPDKRYVTISLNAKLAQRRTSKAGQIQTEIAEHGVTVSLADGHTVLLRTPLVKKEIADISSSGVPGGLGKNAGVRVIEKDIPKAKPERYWYILIKPTIIGRPETEPIRPTLGER